jgi:2-oxoglutarate ferredoxin oxidoreductase subunit alpha
VAAINMVYGAACTGARVMTSSSSPGISLMMEGLSYISATEVPVVVFNVMRGGPGLGNIAPAQADYSQMVHGGGHGDYKPIVFAPASVQELIDYTILAFDVAEKYRTIVSILIDGSIGQMMEPAELPPMQPVKQDFPEWAVHGAKGRERRLLISLFMNPDVMETVNMRLLARWQKIQAAEVRYKEYFLEDAEFAVIGFGTAGRIALSAVRSAREDGIKVGLLRPISLSPFPSAAVKELSQRVQAILVTEMNAGQMLNDVLLNTQGRVPVEFYGRTGGVVPMADEILAEIKRLISGPLTTTGHPRDRWVERMLEKFPQEVGS